MVNENGHVSLSSTAVVTALGCLAKYNYRHNLRLVAKPENVPVALRRGIWIHAALEQIHKGRGWGQQLTAMSQWAIEHGVPKVAVDEMAAEVVDIVNGYTSYWAERERYPLEPVGAEIPLEYVLPSGDRLTATLDTLVRYRGEIYIFEHKSTQRFPDADWRTLDPQTAIQYLLARLNKIEVVGVIFNYLSTYKPAVPEVTKTTKEAPRFYAREITCSTPSFEKGAAELRRVFAERYETTEQGAFESTKDYIEEQRAKLVRDDKFYLRETIYKPDALVAEVLRSVRWCFEAIRACQASGYWPRNVDMMRCPLCTYHNLCPTEAFRGGVASNLREIEFVEESLDLRSEGRTVAQIV